jgi:uncharacterized protein DUF6152
MRAARVMILAGAGLFWVATLGFAHHSFSAEYDSDQPITLKGKVTKVSWKNPHVTFLLDVKDGDGAVTNWELELGSPNLLLSQGWTLTSVKVGDEVTAEGYRARNGAHIASIRKVTVDAP